MPTIVNITVAPSGGDYTSLNTALASIPADIVATDEQYNVNCETFVGGLNEAVTFPAITQDATRFVRIQAAAGHEYNPVDDTGFFLISNVGFAGTFTSSINFVQIVNFGVKNNRVTGNGRGIDFFGDNGVISGMYAESTSTSAAILYFLNNANNLVISECLAYNGTTGFDFGNNGIRTAYKLTSVDATTAGIDTGSATATITNSLSITSADPYLGTFSGSSSNNASSSTDAPGANPQNNRTNSDFVNYAGNDFRTSASSPLYTAGVGGTFIGYAEQPTGITITLQPQNVTVDEGTPWSITSSATGATSSEWYKDGAPTGNTTDTFNGTGLPSESGSYFNRYSNAVGDTDTDTIQVTVNPNRWALAFNGSSYLDVPTSQTHAWVGRSEYEYEISLRVPATTTEVRLIGRNEDLAGTLRILPTGIRIRYGSASSTEYSIPATIPFNNEWFVLKISRNLSDQHKVHVNGTEVGSITNTAEGEGFFARRIGQTQADITQAFDLEYLQFGTVIGGTRLYNWSAADSSHTSGTPILVDIAGGNNGFGVGFNNDGSDWFQILPPGIFVNISESGPSFSESIVANVEAPTVINATISESGPSFSENIIASLAKDLSATIAEAGPGFNESISANITGNVTANIIETGPSFTESVNVNLTGQGLIASITEQGPSFTESINTTLTANISANISESGPSFSETINAQLSADILATITESGPSFAESSVLNIPVFVTVNPKNTVRVKRKSNSVKIKKSSNTIRVT